MGFGKNNIGLRDEYIVCSSNRAQGDQAYNEDGLPIYESQTNIEFWGDVEDLPSNKTDYMGRYRTVNIKKIVCDSRDLEGLDEDFTVIIEGSETKYQIVDVIDTAFKFTAELIIERII
jgi:hypothetical protein